MDTPCDVSVLPSICVYKFGNHGLVLIGIPRSKTQKKVILQRSKLLCPETAEPFFACPCVRAALQESGTADLGKPGQTCLVLL